MDPSFFTNSSRHLLQGARGEAAALGHEYVGTEHVLLAMLHDASSEMPSLLTDLGADPDAVLGRVFGTVKRGTSALAPTAERPFTSRAKTALQLAMSAAVDGGRSPVSPRDLLAGLVQERKGIAAQLLAEAGVTAECVEYWRRSRSADK